MSDLPKTDEMFEGKLVFTTEQHDLPEKVPFSLKTLEQEAQERREAQEDNSIW